MTRPTHRTMTDGACRSPLKICAAMTALLLVFAACSKGKNQRSISSKHEPSGIEAVNESPKDQTTQRSAIQTPRIRAKPKGPYDQSAYNAYVEAVKQHGAECKRRLDAAKTPAESDAAKRFCDEEAPAFQEEPFSHQFGITELEQADMLVWWPHRPLLKFEHPPDGTKQRIYVQSPKGLKGDPRREAASVMFLYQTDRASADSAGSWRLVLSGAILVNVLFLPTGQTQPLKDPLWGWKPIYVRGHPARMFEYRDEHETWRANRSVMWDEAVEGGTLNWSISVHPDLFGESDHLVLVERLIEFR